MSRIAIVALKGSHLNIEVSGAGPAIVAIHGFTGNASNWMPFRETAQAEFSVVCPDMLGHGASDSPDDPRLYDMEHTVAALEEVLTRLKLQRVTWLGYSMGGRIALAAAIALAGRTASLTIESASPGLSKAEDRADRIKSDGVIADRLEQAGIIDFVNYWESLPLWASQTRLPAGVLAKIRLQRLANNPAGLANSLRGIGTGAQTPLHQRLPEIRCPALFVAGEDDVKYAGIAREMHLAVPGSRLEIITQAGHAVHLEQPARFNRTVIDFLRQVTGVQTNPLSRNGSRLNR